MTDKIFEVVLLHGYFVPKIDLNTFQYDRESTFRKVEIKKKISN